MNIINKAIVEYKYCRKFKCGNKIESIKYAITHMFDKDRDFYEFYKAVEKAADRIRATNTRGHSNYLLASKQFVDNNMQFIRDNKIEVEILPINFRYIHDDGKSSLDKKNLYK